MLSVDPSFCMKRFVLSPLLSRVLLLVLELIPIVSLLLRVDLWGLWKHIGNEDSVISSMASPTVCVPFFFGSTVPM